MSCSTFGAGRFLSVKKALVVGPNEPGVGIAQDGDLDVLEAAVAGEV